MRFFRVPNQIFDFRLTPKAFRTYIFLLSKANIFQTAVVGYEGIASACRMSMRSASSAVQELVSAGLLVKENRYHFLGYAKNKYTVRRLPGGWFKVGMDVIESNLKNTDFIVYCFIRKCMDSKHEEAFPSLNAISKGTGISHSRVSVAVRYLREHTYLNRVKRHYRKTRAYRHNRYLLFRFWGKKRRVHSAKRTLQALKLSHFVNFIFNYILERGDKIVKRFSFVVSKVVQILHDTS